MMTPNKSDRLYLQLRRRIAAMRDGEAFPTVRQLMAEYGVSQSTVTPAINLLKEKGLLEAYVGRGSFVCKQTDEKPCMLLLQNNWPSRNFIALAESLQKYAEANGFRFRRELYDYREDITQSLHSFDADIIVIDGIANDLLQPEQVLAISNSPAPVILSRNAVSVSRINYVCGDNTAAGMNVANYLYRMGHRKLGLLFNEPHIYTGECYARGFKSCAASNGCNVEVLDCAIRPGERSDQRIAEFMAEFAAGKYDFTALFPISCEGAAVAYERLQEHGVRVPEDLSIISAGTTPKFDWLTAIDSGMEETSEYIIKMAHDILSHGSKFRRQIEFPQKLVEEHSVRNLTREPAERYG